MSPPPWRGRAGWGSGHKRPLSPDPSHLGRGRISKRLGAGKAGSRLFAVKRES